MERIRQKYFFGPFDMKNISKCVFLTDAFLMEWACDDLETYVASKSELDL